MYSEWKMAEKGITGVLSRLWKSRKLGGREWAETLLVHMIVSNASGPNSMHCTHALYI